MTSTSKDLFISVILPMYNAERYIEESVQSILKQTYENFELIIIDDGSKDHSRALVKGINDRRIKYLYQSNSGMAASLNTGIESAKGEIIARQDADDISHPDRFEKQISFLTENPGCGLLGTWSNIFSDNSPGHAMHQHPTDNLLIKLFLLFDNPFVHSSVMIRKTVLDAVGNYDVNKSSLIQDYDLWSRVARNYTVANLPELLLDYRETEGGISRTTTDYSGDVIEQAMENMNFFLEEKSDAVADIACLFHGRYKKLSKNISIEKIEKCFYKVTDRILSMNPGDASTFNDMREKYLESFRRKVKNYRQFGPWYFFLYRKYKAMKAFKIKSNFS